MGLLSNNTLKKCLFLILIIHIGQAHAVVTTDSTLGTIVNNTGNDFLITAGTKVQSNLFHSFDKFSLATGQSATFVGPAMIDNIVSRVTGGEVSNIDGAINSHIQGANLWLINPSGVVFGQNASLNLTGSFHVSTADYLVLGSGNDRFYSNKLESSVLTTAAPTAFGFLDNSIAPITFEGGLLQLDDEAVFSVVGGDINNTDTTIYVKGGRINLAAVAAAGEVHLDADGISTEGISEFGDISVTHTTFYSTRPRDGYVLGNIDVSGNSGGKIFIRSGRLEMDNGYMYADTRSDGSGGEINMVLDHDLVLKQESLVSTDALSSGDGGTINISAENVELRQGGQISVSSGHSGNAGTLNLNATGSITIDGKSQNEPHLFSDTKSAIIADAIRAGHGGNINITTPVLNMSDGAEVTASALRNGDAGSIHIDVNELNVLSGAAVYSDTRGEGNAGTITINATNKILITGASEETHLASAIQSNTYSSGNGGDITINTSELTISDKGWIQADMGDNPKSGQPAPTSVREGGNILISSNNLSLTGGGQISTTNSAGGTSGVINIDARTVTISGESSDKSQVAGIFSVTNTANDGGQIRLNTQQLDMSENGSINTSSLSEGNAGIITIDTGAAVLTSGARVSSSVGGTGDAGSITLVASDTLQVSGTGSDGVSSGFYTATIVTEGRSASDVSGSGGNISLAANRIVMSDNAAVSARSEGTGDAGRIKLTSDTSIEMYSGASISTEALIGGGGQIDILTRDLLHMEQASITSSVADGSGNGGNIFIDPIFIVLQGSSIKAQAFAGDGGSINMIANYFFADGNTVIDASSEFGVDGNVEVDSPDTDVSGALADLSADFLNASALLRSKCSARSASNESSLVIKSRGGVPSSPADLMGISVLPTGASTQSSVINAQMQDGGDECSA
ncbi:MAG: filamentous hemagglutinin N-terminal domain-containing protein [Gammaproteobacteria bacterium]|nr:filamentous hemagglutinin N-terminal domain-containing protein [Gammaproteobacteria bacterium]